MTGLLIKDLRLMKNQGKFFIGITIFALVISLMTENPFFVVSYLTFIYSFFSVSAISYDEYNNGYSFLFTLPIDRKNYTASKYVFTLLLTVGATVLAFLLMCIGFVKQGRTGEITEWIVPTIGVVMVVLIYLALIIPLQLKFGVEKGRTVMFAVFGGVMAVGFVVVKFIEAHVELANRMLNMIYGLTGLQAALVTVAVCGVIMAVSFGCSLKIMKNKEF